MDLLQVLMPNLFSNATYVFNQIGKCSKNLRFDEPVFVYNSLTVYSVKRAV